MRAETRRSLRTLVAHGPAENRVWQGVAGVADPATRAGNTLPHQAPHLQQPEKPQQDQCATPATPRHTVILEGEGKRHTYGGAEQGVAAGGCRVLQPDAEPQVILEDWLAYYEERAAIREFEGGYDRAEAERLALEETITTLGPRPGQLH